MTATPAQLDAELTARYLAKRCLALEDANTELTAALTARTSEWADLQKAHAQLRLATDDLAAESGQLRRDNEVCVARAQHKQEQLEARIRERDDARDERDRLRAELARRTHQLDKSCAQCDVLGAENARLKADQGKGYRIRGPGIYVALLGSQGTPGLEVFQHAADDAVVLTRAMRGQLIEVADNPDGGLTLRLRPSRMIDHGPGIYVVSADAASALGATRDVRFYKHEDAVVLTDPPSAEKEPQWVQFYRDGLTGAATAFAPAHVVVGIDPGTPEGDVTTYALRVNKASDPAVDRSLTGRLARLERWTQQFIGTSQYTATNTHFTVAPLKDIA